MKKLRFLLALWAARLLVFGCRLFHRNGSHNPGALALKICPDFLEQIEKPAKILAVTGTNGKTTVMNMVMDVLADQGVSMIGNRSGSNILGGVTTALISGVDLLGHCKVDLAVLELDERASRFVYPHVQPDLLLVTNLFQDAIKRNAHTDFIFNIIDSGIPEKTRLVLNGDDPIVSRLAVDNPRVYYGLEPQEGEPMDEPNITQDMRICPYCGSLLEFDFRRYHHIGRCHCPNCEYTSPAIDYDVTEVSDDALTMTIHGESYSFGRIGLSIPDAYNQASAIALLSEYGFTPQTIAESLKKVHIITSRLNIVQEHGKNLVFTMAKGQSPIACSRMFDMIRQRSEDGSKAVVLMFDDQEENLHSSENISWIYTADFEFLNQEDIIQIVCSGVRCQDYKVRLLLAGVPEEKIVCCEHENDAASLVTLDADTLYFLYDVYTTQHAQPDRATIVRRLTEQAEPTEQGGAQA